MSERITSAGLSRLRRALVSMVAIVGFGGSSHAMLLLHWPIDYVVLKSELIVKGHFIDEHHILVDEVFYGAAVPSQGLLVKEHIELSRIADDPSRECDPVQQKNRFNGKPCRLLSDEPVLLFLQKSKTDRSWEPTGWGSGVKWIVDGKVLGYYQLDNPGPYVLLRDYEAGTPEDLYRVIASALQKRARYEAALNEKDPKNSIAGFLPFVQDPKHDWYWREAVFSLATIGPAAGVSLRQLAEKLKGNYSRVTVIEAMGKSADADSTKYLAEIVSAAKPLVQKGAFKFAAATQDERTRMDEWKTALCALAEIGDGRALPLFRESIFDAYQVEEFYGAQAAGCIEQGLNKNPTLENLLMFQKLYGMYPRWYAWQGSARWASWSAMEIGRAHV